LSRIPQRGASEESGTGADAEKEQEPQLFKIYTTGNLSFDGMWKRQRREARSLKSNLKIGEWGRGISVDRVHPSLNSPDELRTESLTELPWRIMNETVREIGSKRRHEKPRGAGPAAAGGRGEGWLCSVREGVGKKGGIMLAAVRRVPQLVGCRATGRQGHSQDQDEKEEGRCRFGAQNFPGCNQTPPRREGKDGVKKVQIAIGAEYGDHALVIIQRGDNDGKKNRRGK